MFLVSHPLGRGMLSPVAWSLFKTLIFTIVFPGTVAVYVPYRLRAPGPPPISALAALGIATVAIGLGVYLWCAWDFATFGQGTPLPLDAPKQLVARGLYRFVRNPMYVGVLLVIFGQALCFESLPALYYGLAVALAFHLFILAYEEPVLRRKFGPAYEHYMKTVPRWLPKLAA